MNKINNLSILFLLGKFFLSSETAYESHSSHLFGPVFNGFFMPKSNKNIVIEVCKIQKPYNQYGPNTSIPVNSTISFAILKTHSLELTRFRICYTRVDMSSNTKSQIRAPLQTAKGLVFGFVYPWKNPLKLSIYIQSCIKRLSVVGIFWAWQ